MPCYRLGSVSTVLPQDLPRRASTIMLAPPILTALNLLF